MFRLVAFASFGSQVNSPRGQRLQLPSSRFTAGEEISITAHVIKSPPTFGPAVDRTVVDVETDELADETGEAEI